MLEMFAPGTVVLFSTKDVSMNVVTR